MPELTLEQIREQRRKQREEAKKEGDTLFAPNTSTSETPFVAPQDPYIPPTRPVESSIDESKEYLQQFAYAETAQDDTERRVEEGDITNQYIVPTAFRVVGPAAYPWVHKHAQAGAKALKNLKMARDARRALRLNPVAKTPTPLGLGLFLTGEVLIGGVGSEYLAQRHEKAYGYIDEINPGHLIAAGMVNSFTYKGFTKLGDILPKPLKLYPPGSKLNAAGKAFNTLKRVGGYSIRGGTIGSASAAIDEAWKDLTDDERQFLKDWNTDYIGKSFVTGAIMDNAFALGGKAATRVFNTKNFKKGTAILKRVANKALLTEEAAIEKAIIKLNKDLQSLEKEWSVSAREGSLAGRSTKASGSPTYNDFRQKYQSLKDDLSTLNAHKKDVGDLLRDNAERLQELERITAKRIEEQTLQYFTRQQLKTPQYKNYFGEQVYVNPKGEVLLYEAPNYKTNSGQIALTTKRPKVANPKEYRVLQKDLGKNIIDQPLDGSVVFSTSIKKLKKYQETAKTAANTTRAQTSLLKEIKEGDTTSPATAKTPEEFEQRLRGSRKLYSKQLEDDIKFLERNTPEAAGNIAGQEAAVYYRLSKHVEDLVYNARQLSDLTRSPNALKDFEDYLDAVERLSKAAGRADYPQGTRMLARKQRTKQEVEEFQESVKDKEISETNIEREKAFKELREAFDEFKQIKQTAKTEAAADAVEDLSRSAISARKKKAKENEKAAKNALKKLHLKLWNTGQSSKSWDSQGNQNILDALLAARTSGLLTSPDTLLLGTASYVTNGLLLNPVKQTVGNVREAFGKDLKGAGLVKRISYATSSTPFNITRNNYLLQNILALFKDMPLWLENSKRSFQEGGSSQIFRKYGRWDDNKTGPGLTRREEISLRRLQRKEDGKGIISRASGAGMDEFVNFFSHMGSLLGAADEPFFYALYKSELAAEGQRLAIKAGATSKTQINAYVNNYVKRNLNTDDMGLIRITNAGDGNKAANRAGRAMGRSPVYGQENVDYRYTVMEEAGIFGSKILSSSTGNRTLDNAAVRALAKIIFPVFKIPVNLTGACIDLMLSPGTAVTKGISKLKGRGNIEKEFGFYSKDISKAEKQIKSLEELLDKNKGGSPAEIEQINLNLNSAKKELQKFNTLRTEQTNEIIGKAALAMGLMYFGKKLAEEGLITGTGFYLTPEQKRELGFQSYRMGDNTYAEAGDFVQPTGRGGMDFRYLDAAKLSIAIGADFYQRGRLIDEGILEDKRLDNTAIGFLNSFGSFNSEALLELPVFSGINDLMDVATQQNNNYIRRQASTFLSPIKPSGLKKLKQIGVNQPTQDISKGSDKDAILSYGGVLDAGNYKRNWLGEPMLKDALEIPGLFIRSWPKKAPPFTALDKIALNDSLLGQDDSIIRNVSGVASINRAKLEDFSYQGLTLDNAFDNIRVNLKLNKAPYNGKKQREYLEELIKTKEWQRKFNNGQYTINPEDETRTTNEGMVEIRKVINDYKKETEKRLLEKEYPVIDNFTDADGYNIFGYIELLKAKNKAKSR